MGLGLVGGQGTMVTIVEGGEEVSKGSFKKQKNIMCFLGDGQGSCSAAGGCPSFAPVCSEFGYCQCASYVRGGQGCGPGVTYGGGTG